MTNRSRFLCLVTGVAVTVAGCGETSPSALLSAGGITVMGATAVSGPAGQTLAEPVNFRVVDTNDQPLPGVPVTFAATGDGALVNPASTVTDAQGVAHTRWTLPVASGSSVLTATAGNATAQVTATVGAGAAGRVEAHSTANQAGVAGEVVPAPPSVRVTDAFGNPVAGAPVTFSVHSGGGRVTDFVRTTDSDGTATVGSWVLGPPAGAQTLLARVEAPGVTGNPVVFTAVALAGSPSRLLALSAMSQTATAGTTVAAAPTVQVLDAGGNPVQGANVSFAVTSGGGQVSSTVSTTNAEGTASAGTWLLGPQAGANTVTASVPGAGSVLFTAVGTPGQAAQFTIVEGNNQSAQVTRAVAVAPRVMVRDNAGNPVPGIEVNFQAATGGGTVVSGRQVTDATGTAQVGAWFLGSSPGPNTLTATAAGLPTLTFTATATPGQPAVMSAQSSTSQTGVVGTAVADAPAVIIRDALNNPVPGVTVTFAVTAGGGSVTRTGGVPASSVTVTSDVTGRASLSAWVLGTTLTQNTVTASAPGLPSVVFTATPAAGAPASVGATAGQNAVAVQGTAVPARPTVRVLDANGNVVAGARVVFSVQGGGGTITGATQTTDAAGVATVGSWVLGAGTNNQLWATVTDADGTMLDITGNPVLFQARAATAVGVAEAPASATLGQTFQIRVQLIDAEGSAVPLSGVQLGIEMSGGGTLSGSMNRTTDSQGAAVFTLSVTGDAGPRTFTIGGPGLLPTAVGPINFN